MAIRSNADLDFMLKDAGEPVVFGAQPTFGILRTAPILREGDLQYMGQHIELSIRDGSLAGLVDEAAIVVAGSDYVIRDTGFARANGLRTLTLVAA